MLSLLAKFKLGRVQLIYSIIILLLVCIGLFKIFRQSFEKYREKKPRRPRKKSVIDAMVDTRNEMKAINLASNPTQTGEDLGFAIIQTMKGWKKIMKKLKVLFDKFKGYLLAALVFIMGVIEMFGGYINDCFGDKLILSNGVNLLALITLGLAIIIAGISNGWTKEKMEKIKAMFSKSNSDELVIAEIKKTLKEDEIKLKDCQRALELKNTELDNLNASLVVINSRYESKIKMTQMTPQLATQEDVSKAAAEVKAAQEAIATKKAEIAEVSTNIERLQVTINALKGQLV